MFDPLLCDPAEKAELEADNGVAQLEYIANLVLERRITAVRESHLLDLHRLAVQGIYPCEGQYRNALRRVHIEGSSHQVPDAAFVHTHVVDLLERINASERPALWRASYALWRLNWIHPFSGGNGRTSRALSYLILCIDLGATLPGVPTVPTLIYERRHEYMAALQQCDASARTSDDGEPDLSSMNEFVKDVVTRQLASAIARLEDGAATPA